jgi:cytochrome P450
MKGTALAAALDELGVDRDNYRVLALLPLVYMAWADGKVQRSERSLIHRVAKLNGWLGDDGDSLLIQWLDEPPTEDYVASGLEVLRSLAGSVPSSEDSVESLLAYCREVATAAGSLFGERAPVTEEETRALSEIADALGVENVARWRDISGEDDSEEPPRPGPRGHVLVGNLLDFDESPLTFLLDAANNYGDIVHFTISGDEVYLLRRPEHVALVLEERRKIYRRGAQYRALAEVLGPSLLTEEDARWETLRELARPAFTDARVEGFAGTIVEATDRMLDRWQAVHDEGRELDIAPEMLSLVLALVGDFVFGADLGDPEGELTRSVAAILDHASHAMDNPFRIHEASLGRRRRFREAKDAFDETFHEIVAKRHSRGGDGRGGQGGSEPATDLLAELMRAEEPLEDRELETEVLTFLLAGHQTTAVALSWIFFTLSRHMVAARRVYREVRDKLASRKPTRRDARVLTYTNMAIDEVLRLHPPVWSIDREARRDDTIDGVSIAKGSVVMVSPWVTHRSPALWTNPEGFDPERFNERAVAKRPAGAYFPFGLGPHTCIGRGLAQMILRLVVPRVLQRFRLDLVVGFEPKRDAQLTLQPDPGIRMTLRTP